MKISKKTLYRIPIFIFLVIFILNFSFDFVLAVCNQDAPEYWRVNVWVGNTLKITWADTSDDGSETANYDIGNESAPNSSLCTSEGDVVAQFLARVQIVETCDNNLDFTSTNSSAAYNINWDANQTDCECLGQTWSSVNSKCCGDDGAYPDDEDCFQDIGLRFYNGSDTVTIAVNTLNGSALRIAKNGIAYNISLVDTSHAKASKIRIQTSSGVKAIRKL